MAASTLQPITEVANPVIVCTAVRAQAAVFAVTITRAARMSKASAKVSRIRTPRRSIAPPFSLATVVIC
jgi:hypothetical protein